MSIEIFSTKKIHAENLRGSEPEPEHPKLAFFARAGATSGAGASELPGAGAASGSGASKLPVAGAVSGAGATKIIAGSEPNHLAHCFSCLPVIAYNNSNIELPHSK